MLEPGFTGLYCTVQAAVVLLLTDSISWLSGFWCVVVPLDVLDEKGTFAEHRYILIITQKLGVI